MRNFCKTFRENILLTLFSGNLWIELSAPLESKCGKRWDVLDNIKPTKVAGNSFARDK